MYMSTAMSDTMTLAGKAATKMENCACCAVAFDENGDFVLAEAGANAAGLLVIDTANLVNVGDVVTVQIKDIALWMTGAAVKAGDELTTDASGKAVVAAAGNFITAIALEGAAAGQCARVQIVKAGYKAAAGTAGTEKEDV